MIFNFFSHYRSFVHSCEKCSPCCEDTQDEDIEQQCLNQGFPKHSACRYTDRKCKTVASNPTSGLTTNHFEKDKQTSSSITWYIVGGCLGLILLIAAVISIFFICRKKKKDPSLIKIAQREWYSGIDVFALMGRLVRTDICQKKWRHFIIQI